MKLVYLMMINICLISCLRADQKPEELPIVDVEVGQSVVLDLGNVNPKSVQFHLQHSSEYVKHFSCKNNHGSCLCKIVIKPKIHEPAIFSIFENLNEY